MKDEQATGGVRNSIKIVRYFVTANCLYTSQPKDFARINSKKQEYLASLGTQGADRRLAVHYRSIGLHVKVFQYVVYICRYVLCVYRVST